MSAAPDIARLRELAALGAERAASVLAGFANAPVHAGPLREDVAVKAPPFETGIDFAVEGALAGRLTLFFDTLSRRSLVRLLLDEEEPEIPHELLVSALCELGNIVASQALSAMADALGSSISLSVPKLELELAPTRLLAGRPQAQAASVAFASELAAPGAELRLLLVFAPAC
jgi:chemotaxis protein CheC